MLNFVMLSAVAPYRVPLFTVMLSVVVQIVIAPIVMAPIVLAKISGQLCFAINLLGNQNLSELSGTFGNYDDR
jgi:hypothetical protein